MLLPTCGMLLFNTGTVASGNAGIEPRTVATLALTARRNSYSARSHPLSARSHPQLGQISSALSQISSTLGQISSTLDKISSTLGQISFFTRLELIHNRVDLIRTRLYLIHTRLDLIHTRLDLIYNRLDVIRSRLDFTHEIIFSCLSSINFVSYFPVSAFVTSYNLYIVTKFCVGFFTAGNILSIFVLGKLSYCTNFSHSQLLYQFKGISNEKLGGSGWKQMLRNGLGRFVAIDVYMRVEHAVLVKKIHFRFRLRQQI